MQVNTIASNSHGREFLIAINLGFCENPISAAATPNAKIPSNQGLVVSKNRLRRYKGAIPIKKAVVTAISNPNRRQIGSNKRGKRKYNCHSLATVHIGGLIEICVLGLRL